jgi:hypothetical protein
MTGGGTDGDGFGQLRIAEAAVILQQSQHLKVDTIETSGHGRSFRIWHLFRKE